MTIKDDQAPAEAMRPTEEGAGFVGSPSLRGEHAAPSRAAPPEVGIAPLAEEEVDEAPQSRPLRRRHDEVNPSVLRGCVARDEVSFAEFVLCYQNLVFAILSRRLGYGPHIEDLAQDVFWKAYVAFPQFQIRDDAPPSTWLGTIARNVATDEKRRLGIRTIATEDPEPGYAPPMSERAALLRLALSRLPERACEAFLLHQLEGMSLREVGTILQIAPNTARTLVEDATLALRKQLLQRGIAG